MSPPTSEAAHFEAGESRTLVPSRKQGYNYQNALFAGDLPFLGLLRLPLLAPAQVLTDRAQCPRRSDGKATPQTPFEIVPNLFLLYCFPDINLPAPGASNPLHWPTKTRVWAATVWSVRFPFLTCPTCLGSQTPVCLRSFKHNLLGTCQASILTSILKA